MERRVVATPTKAFPRPSLPLLLFLAFLLALLLLAFLFGVPLPLPLTQGPSPFPYPYPYPYAGEVGVGVGEEGGAGPFDVVYTWVNGSDPRLLLDLAQARLDAGLVPPVTANTTSEKAKKSDVDSMSRFVDNEELRYSLRSVERYAPWVRNIYIVTNGQIPYWLDISHPRIHIITHEMLFTNKSHLPTFSSPAIECHLHRIPGLSKKFLYFNDDTLLGMPVWPDDFYTTGKGAKVFLAWPVPDCAEGCPSSWIGDGYCDQACNVSACGFDANDCKNATRANSGGSSSWSGWGSWGTGSTGGSNADYCSWGCPDSWVGDRYCDRPCQNPACGMDGGDCGANAVFSNVWGANITDQTTRIVVPLNTSAIYLGMSDVIGSARIVDGTHDGSKIVRTATVSQKNKLMVLTFRKNITRTEVQILVTAMDNERKIEVPVNISVDTDTAVGTEIEEEDDLYADDEYDYYYGALSDEMDGLADPALQSDWLSWESEKTSSENTEDAPNPLRTTRGRSLLALTEKKSNSVNRPLRKDPGLIRDGKVARLSKLNSWLHDLSHPTLLPWETASFNEDREPLKWRRRKLLDAFGDSLRFVNRLMDNEFGRESRRVIAHMPHMIDRDVVNQMQARWPEEFNATSSHKFRGSNDMQFSFSHFYFLMSQREDFNFTTIWARDLDLDGSGYLEENELRTLTARLYGAPVDEKVFAGLLDKLRDGKCRLAANDTANITTASGGITPSTLNRDISESLGPVSSLSPALSYSSQPSTSMMLSATLQDSSQPLASYTQRSLKALSETDRISPQASAQTTVQLPQLKEIKDKQPTVRKGRNKRGRQSVEEKQKQEEAKQQKKKEQEDKIEKERQAKLKAEEAAQREAELQRARDAVLLFVDPIRVPPDDLLGCPELLEKLQDHYAKITKNKFEAANEDDIWFLMVHTNATATRGRLDGIRAKPRKFVCLNDDIDHADPGAVATLQIIRRFYESMQPVKSSFELPPELSNPFLHYDDMMQHGGLHKRLPTATMTGQETSPAWPLWIWLALIAFIGLCMWRVWTGSQRRKTNFD